MSVLVIKLMAAGVKFENYMEIMVGTILVLFPLALVTLLVGAAISLLICKYFNAQLKEVLVAVVAYAACGSLLGYCVGYGKTPLLGAVLGFAFPVLVGVIGGLFKESRTVLIEYAPICLGSITSLVSSMLISIVYADKIFPNK